MSILVTGGAGFIGSHLVERLLSEGHKVTVIDNNKTGDAANLEGLPNSHNLTYVISDLSEPSQVLEDLVKESTHVFHLASSVGVDVIDSRPQESLINNLKATLNLLPLVEKYGAKFIFTSTSEVYGSKDLGSFSETDTLQIGAPTKLRWSYASSKLTQEFLIRSYNIPSLILRLFNVVGPKQVGNYGMVLPRFINAAKTDQPLVVYGDGYQIRCFCHIADCVDAMMRLAFDGRHYGEIFNIGNDKEVTILGLAKTVKKVLGSGSEIQMVPYEKVFSKQHGEIMRRVPNITKLREAIGYSPKHSLEDIIRDMHDFR